MVLSTRAGIGQNIKRRDVGMTRCREAVCTPVQYPCSKRTVLGTRRCGGPEPGRRGSSARDVVKALVLHPHGGSQL